MFSTDLANKIEMANGGLSAGIHENVKLESVKVDTSMNGNTFLEIKFSKDGNTATQTEWEPKKFGDQTEEAFQLTCSKQVSRMLQILRCFYSEDKLQFTGATFKEFVEWVAKLLNEADKNILLRVKLVYKPNGFIELPRYAKFVFIEPMTISKEDSKIAILNIDQMVKPVVADKEENEENPLNIVKDVKEDDLNELPF